MKRVFSTKTYLGNLLILELDHLELVLHLVLQFNKEPASDFSYSRLREFLQSVLFGFPVNLLEFFLKNWGTLLKCLCKSPLKLFLSLLLSPLTL
jgi:hypothetical protein